MRRAFRVLGVLLERHPALILGGAALITAASVFGVRAMEWKTGQDTMVSSSSTVFQDTERYQAEFGGDAVLILLTADLSTIFSTENLPTLQALERALSEVHGIKIVIGPATLLGSADTLPDDSGAPNSGDSDSRVLTDFDTSLLYNADGEIDPRLSLVVPDDGHALIAVRMEGGLGSEAEEDVVDVVEDTVDGHTFTGVEVLVTGTPMIEPAIRDDMSQDMRLMLVLSVILMVVVLFVVFRARWRLLSLPLVLLGVLWSFGVMGFISLPLSMVTMSGLPILIGLGVDYAIQFHNRYEEEIGRGDSPAAAVIDAMTHIGPAVGIAVLATALGFIVLLISPVPMIRDFGVQITIGVVVLYVVGLLLLNAVLYQRDKRSDAVALRDTVAASSDRAQRFLAGLARSVISRPIPILLVAVVASGVGFYLDQHLTVQTDFEELMPQDNPALVDLRAVDEVLGGTREVGILIEGEDLDRSEVLEWMLSYQQQEQEEFSDGIVTSTSLASLVASQNGGGLPPPAELAGVIADLPSSTRGSVISADGSKASISFTTASMPVAELHDMIGSLKDDLDPPPGISAAPAGRFVIIAQGMVGLTQNRELITLLALAAISGGLLIVYRNLTRSLLPVIPIALVVGWSSAVMYVASIELNPLTAVLGALIIGIGTEFTILLMERYHEEKARGLPPREAMVVAVSRIGRAITASGLTVIAGFSALLFSDFPMLQDFGKVTVIDVFLSLVSTLVVLPPIIVWVDELRGSGVLTEKEAA